MWKKSFVTPLHKKGSKMETTIGVLLDPRLRFADHISSVVNIAMGALGFIKKWSKDFDEPYSR